MGEHSYLCWTISPEISCVIEYSADVIGQTEIVEWTEIIEKS